MSEELEKLRHKQYVAERKLTAANFWGSTKAVRRLSFSAGELAVGQKIKAGTEVFHDGEGAEIQVLSLIHILVSLIGGLCLVIPGTMTDGVGIALIAMVLLVNHFMDSRSR